MKTGHLETAHRVKAIITRTVSCHHPFSSVTMMVLFRCAQAWMMKCLTRWMKMSLQMILIWHIAIMLCPWILTTLMLSVSMAHWWNCPTWRVRFYFNWPFIDYHNSLFWFCALQSHLPIIKRPTAVAIMEILLNVLVNRVTARHQENLPPIHPQLVPCHPVPLRMTPREPVLYSRWVWIILRPW